MNEILKAIEESLGEFYDWLSSVILKFWNNYPNIVNLLFALGVLAFLALCCRAMVL